MLYLMLYTQIYEILREGGWGREIEQVHFRRLFDVIVTTHSCRRFLHKIGGTSNQNLEKLLPAAILDSEKRDHIYLKSVFTNFVLKTSNTVSVSLPLKIFTNL